MGQVSAEPLCAGLLRICGYSDVDPQVPLGGRDGKKDIVAWRGGRKYIAACYFPTTPVGFNNITKKYKLDYPGVDANGADGFVFFVNQLLTVGERAKLLEIGNPSEDEVFHLERIRGELDSPRGYSLRLKHLRIPMNAEEQVSYFNTYQQDMIQRLIRNESEPDWGIPAIARLDVSMLQMLHEIMLGTTPHSGMLRAITAMVIDSDGRVVTRRPRPTSSTVNSRITAHGGAEPTLTRLPSAMRSVWACSQVCIMALSRRCRLWMVTDG